jgi:Rieske 2Fe-2S family protein
LCEGCGTAQLKIAARRSVPTKANWKLVIENFRECYHCQPSHANSYIRAYWQGDETLSAAQVARIEEEIRRHGHQPTDYWESMRYRAVGGPDSSMVGSPASRSYGQQHWRPGFETASLDGKPVAPLLPGLKARSHVQGNASASGYRRRTGSSGHSTSGVIVVDDYAFSYRFTPRDVRLTDVEMVYLVHPDAQEGKDYDVEHMVGLWHNTLREDRWVAENNHAGLFSSRYAFKGGQPYMYTEGGPAAFMKWYMSQVVPAAGGSLAP